MTSFKAKKVWPKLPMSPVQKALKSKARNTPQTGGTTTPDDVADEAEVGPVGLDLTIKTRKNKKTLRTVRLKKNKPLDPTELVEVEAADEVEDEEEVEGEVEVVIEEVPLPSKKATKKSLTPKTTKMVNKLREMDPDRKPDEVANDHEAVSEVEAEGAGAEDEVEDEAGPVTKASLVTKTPLHPPPQQSLQKLKLQLKNPRHQKLKTKLVVFIVSCQNRSL